MPLKLNLEDISIEEVKRYLGYKKNKHTDGEKITDLIKNLIEENYTLLLPEGEYITGKVIAEESQEIITDVFPRPIKGSTIIKHLSNSTFLSFILVTIGNKIDKRLSEYFEKGEYTNAVILDAIGTVAVEKSADMVNGIIAVEAKKFGYFLTKRFSPGYGDWSLDYQKDFLRLFASKRMDIKVNEAFLLDPQKSITAVVGWKKNVSTALGETCSCNIECPYRRDMEG
jgi:hypothetical protein